MGTAFLAHSGQREAGSAPSVHDVSTLFTQALAFHQAGRITDAIDLYRQILLLRPDLAACHNNLGAALAALGKIEEAVAAYRQAIAVKPLDPEAHSNLGTVFVQLGKPDEAEAAFRRAIGLKPDCAGAYNNLGLILTEAGRMTEAQWAAEQAVKLAPRDPSYFVTLGEVRRYAAGDRYFAALQALAKDMASLRTNDQILLHFALAKAYADIGRPEDEFRRLLAGNALKRSCIAYDETAVLERMERVRATFTPELCRVSRGAAVPSPIPIFIVGMLRSGTTLVEQILASHPQVFGAGELKLFQQAAADILPAVPGEPEFPEMALRMSDEHFHALGTRYLTDIKRLAPAASHITDKMPSNFLFAGLIHLALPNAIIIHTIRDPVDTCVSCFSKLFTDGQNHTFDLAELGRYYRNYQSLMAHWRRVLPAGRILDVRYEDVVDDLEGQARRIMAHCGLEWDARCLAFHKTKRPVRTASATQVRKRIYTSAIGRGRAYEAFLRPLLDELEKP